MKPNLEERIQEVLKADFDQWIWNLKTGDKIGVEVYVGSWAPPGTQIWYPKRFICIAGNKVFYQDLDNPEQIHYTSYNGSIQPYAIYEKIHNELKQYRLENPDWQNQGM